MTAVLLRIVVLQVEDDCWCDPCGVPCATTVTYVEEFDDDRAPAWVYRLSYCETCDQR